MKRQIIGSLLVGSLVTSAIWIPVSAWINRPVVKIASLTILNPNFAAGDGIQIIKREVLPPNCIPQRIRNIIFPQGCYGHQPHCDAQILTDAGALQNTDPILPTPARMRLGCGDYVERMVAQGCGAFSGILPPSHDTSSPVAVCVLPPRPLPTN